ncbi:MAG: leucine--tRNA ligase [Thermoplasmata archaeon]
MPGQGYDWRTAEARWQERWEEAKAFEARADDARPKYFVNMPYPYMNSLLHLGQGYTFLHAEIMARYKRMQGFNVLFPQAFHVTGLPILGAAKRVADGEEEQMEILRNNGFPEEEIPAFADPLHWIQVFPEETKKDLTAFGASLDWSRSFITTDQNPPYDAFVRWQFRRLREGDYVRLGKHPVIWCPRDEIPIGDHDRFEGEGEVPQEFVLLKFRLMQRYLVAATLRPETIFGTTNVWVDPEAEYIDAQVGDERWIVNEGAVEKLRSQGKDIRVLGKVEGHHLLGQSAVSPMVGDPIPILPTTFIDHSIGTGIVSGVPGDAPDDLVALRELQADDEALEKYNLDVPFVQSLEPIAIIDLEGFGPTPASDVVERMGIKHSGETDRLQRAKEEVYRAEFYNGIMGTRAGAFAGLKVEEAKEKVKAQMLADGQADLLLEPSGPVVCRCLTPALVKVVEDQWFLVYGEPAWKAKTHELLEDLTLYPEAIRTQFHHVIDWLRDWACTHHQGLGTRLPWDEGWVIESLSDSTMYMAYYTIAHILQGGAVDPERLTDGLFDYVFLGQGDPREIARGTGISADVLGEMRREFAYWYPFDLRNSGKDLVPNHFAFMMFNHVALFPPNLWPHALGVNGFISVPGRRMSKSRAGALFLRDAMRDWGADATRLGLAQGGEGLDDASFDTEFAETAGRRLAGLHAAVVSKPAMTEEVRPIDRWFRSILHRAIQGTTTAMESLSHRTALKHAYFDLQREWSWYLRRVGDVPNGALWEEFQEVQAKLLAPYVPHLAEEIWKALGKRGFIHDAPYPKASEEAVDSRAEAMEEFLKDALDDVRQILKATRLAPKRVTFYTAPPWKRAVYEVAARLHAQGKLDARTLIKQARKESDVADHGAALPYFAKRLVSDREKRGPGRLESNDWTVDESAFLRQAIPFAQTELRAEVTVYQEGDPDIVDPLSKANQATPWRPAIFVE